MDFLGNYGLLIILAGTVMASIIITKLVTYASDLLDGDGGYSRAYSDFVGEVIASGGSYTDAADEMYLREIMAKLRRETTAAVLLDLDRWDEIISEKIDAAMREIANENHDLLPHFGAMIKGLPYTHILYKPAADKVTALIDGNSRKVMPTDDQRAALKIVKPA